MALFVNETDQPVTIPDGREGALIVPAGCEAVEGPEGILIARYVTAEAEVVADDAVGEGVANGGVLPDGVLTGDRDGGPELFIPATSNPAAADATVDLVVDPDGTDEQLPPLDDENRGPFEAPAKGRRTKASPA